MRKYASFQVISAAIAKPGAPLMRTAHRASFEYEPQPGFLYVRSRAISSRTNDNFDTFPAEEISKGWRTFIGKPVFVNHHNENHRRARGVIIDAVLHEDTTPDGLPDTWVEVLMEVDAIRFPKLAQAIIAGEVDRTSMGCDVTHSICSFCGNKARTPVEYCAHIPRLKGKKIRRITASGTQEDVLVSEICYGLSFFENSLLVEDPADPTAFFLGVDDRGLKMTASKTAASPKHTNRKTWYHGSVVKLAPGTILTPGKYDWHRDMNAHHDKVWITDSIHEGWYYAYEAMARAGMGRGDEERYRPFIYEVEPMGDPEIHEKFINLVAGASFATCDSARVVRDVTSEYAAESDPEVQEWMIPMLDREEFLAVKKTASVASERDWEPGWSKGIDSPLLKAIRRRKGWVADDEKSVFVQYGAIHATVVETAGEYRVDITHDRQRIPAGKNGGYFTNPQSALGAVERYLDRYALAWRDSAEAAQERYYAGDDAPQRWLRQPLASAIAYSLFGDDDDDSPEPICDVCNDTGTRWRNGGYEPCQKCDAADLARERAEDYLRSEGKVRKPWTDGARAYWLADTVRDLKWENFKGLRNTVHVIVRDPKGRKCDRCGEPMLDDANRFEWRPSTRTFTGRHYDCAWMSTIEDLPRPGYDSIMEGAVPHTAAAAIDALWGTQHLGSHYHDVVVWESEPGRWRAGFFTRLDGGWAPEDEWDAEFDHSSFEWVSRPADSPEAALAQYHGPNPGGYEKTSVPNDVARYNAMASAVTKTSAREDIHSPKNFTSSDYEYVGSFYQGSSKEWHEIYEGRDDAHDELRANLRRFGNPELIDPTGSRWELPSPWFQGNFANRRTCDHCGARFAHGAVFHSKTSGDLIAVGRTCAEKMGLTLDQAQERQRQRDFERAKERERIRQARQEFLRSNPRAQALLGWLSGFDQSVIDENSFWVSLLNQLEIQRGTWSERQMDALEKSLYSHEEYVLRQQRLLEKQKDAEPCPNESGCTITGEVVSTKWQDSDYGGAWKMLVLDDRGFKVWGTIPSSLDVEKGDRVTFIANVEQSDKDQFFGFFKRPRKSQVLSAKTARFGGEPLYHGSKHNLPLGTILLPHGEGGRTHHWDYSEEEGMPGQFGWVYASPSLTIALAFGDYPANRIPGPTFMYEVEPLGKIEPDPAIGQSIRMKRARVIRRGTVSAGSVQWEDELVTASMRTHADRWSEVVAPQQVDTLRDPECPVCGETDAFDGDQCQICGYIQPPSMYLDPNVDTAAQVDRAQDAKEQAPGAAAPAAPGGPVVGQPPIETGVEDAPLVGGPVAPEEPLEDGATTEEPLVSTPEEASPKKPDAEEDEDPEEDEDDEDGTSPFVKKKAAAIASAIFS